MSTEKEDTGMGRYLAVVMKVVAAVVLLTLLPFAVAFNVLGTADRLSSVPGITKGGGAVAGIVALVYVSGILGAATAGGIVATGGEVPFVGDAGPETPEPAPTATPTETPTVTPTATPTATSTPTATPSAEKRRQMQLEAFEEDYVRRLDQTMKNETLTGVPVLGTDYRETDNGKLELWMVFWECDFADGETHQWITGGNYVVNTVGPHEGAQPDRVRLYSVTNLTNFADDITYIRTSDAEAVYTETRDVNVYTENWWERRHEPTQAENETAYEIAVEDSGREVANQAFYNDHADDDAFKCNGGARPGSGSDDRD